jgi:LuxR family transcriptional regulator, maltose regulon positive regulatory protein
MRQAATIAPAPLPDVRPRLRPGMVPRSRLVRSLVACRDTPIAAIVAPPGFGKTTLLVEWAMRDKRPFHWAGNADEALALIDSAAGPQVIVLDDAHAAPAAAIRRVADAAGRLPSGTMVALAARRALAMPVGRLRAHRRLIEIGEGELAMSRMEAAMLLDGAGLQLDAAEVDLLVERTEGWPAPLYLAALALAEEQEVTTFCGADRLVAEYLDDELLSGLTSDQRAFLRRTSVLAQLTGPLCDAVLGADESAAMIGELRHAGIPLEPLDRHEMAFRHHALVAAMLRAELARVEPEIEAALHSRAADWYERHGDSAHALDHAVACRDGARAGALLWSLASAYASDGRARALGRWLAPFSERDLGTHRELALAATAYHLAEGRRAQAERTLTTVAAGPEAALMRACIAREGVAQMGAAAAQGRTVAPAVALLLEGVSRHLTGDREEAQALLEEAMRQATGRVPAVAALCHTQLALLALDAGDLDGAQRRAREAHAMLEMAGAPDPVRALVLAVYAFVAAQCGEVAQSRHDAADAARLLSTSLDFAPWLVAEAHVWLARAEIRLSDGPSARALLARAARIQAQVPDATVLTQWVHDGWERADAFAEGVTGDGPMLTNAELRVLRLLPSHLSFREIGERLHVSTNTVKTQALAVYRKLDVSSRSEAVARGTAAGLIDR